MDWRDTIEKLKKLPEKALALLKRADEKDLHDRIEDVHTEILRQIDRYVTAKEALDKAKRENRGKTIGDRGSDLRQIGIRLRDEVLEAQSLLKKVKDKKYLKEADAWRDEIQAALDKLKQQVDIRRASIAARVVARYKAAHHGTPQER